jgi:hypothetical protein
MSKKRIISHDDLRYKVAEEYIRKQLSNMDGSADAGIKRIGTTQFEETIQTIAQIMTKVK